MSLQPVPSFYRIWACLSTHSPDCLVECHERKPPTFSAPKRRAARDRCLQGHWLRFAALSFSPRLLLPSGPGVHP